MIISLWQTIAHPTAFTFFLVNSILYCSDRSTDPCYSTRFGPYPQPQGKHHGWSEREVVSFHMVRDMPRQNFLHWRKYSIFMLPNVVATSCMWLLSTWNVARTTEKWNFLFNFNFNSCMWLMATIFESADIQNLGMWPN